jgi:hypothetical protein
MLQAIHSKSYSKIRDYYYRSLKKIKKMLEKTGIALGRSQSRTALQCYGKLLKDPATTVKDQSKTATNPSKPPEKADKSAASPSIPSQEVLTKSQVLKPEEADKPNTPVNSAAVAKSPHVPSVSSQKEARSTRHSSTKDVGTQDNLLAATIFQEDYQK